MLISGRMFTGRDAVHSHLMKHEPPVDLRGSVLYHCGPVVVKDGDKDEGWRVTAAGPTTSIREEPYQGEIIKRYGVRAVIGKGGMGAKTLAALKEHGAVYLNAIGGRGAVLRAHDQARGRRVAARLRHARSDVAPDREGLSRDRHHGRARQQPAQGHRAGIREAPRADRGLTPDCELLQRRTRVAVLHRGHVEVHRLQIGDGEQRETAREPACPPSSDSSPQLPQTSTRRSLRSASGAAVTNGSPSSPQYTHAYVVSSQASAQKEQRSTRCPATTSASAGHDPHAAQ